MDKVLDSIVIGQDCYGHYLELSSGRIYIDKVYGEMLPGDRINMRVIQEIEG